MTSRAAAMEVTRERVLEAAADSFTAQWYDDVTMRAIADAAGVALQTVVNHFGTKEPIARGREGHERWCERTFPGALRGLRGAARRRRLAQLVVATDVYTWKLLRRDRGFDRSQTITAVRELVRALHDLPEEAGR